MKATNHTAWRYGLWLLIVELNALTKNLHFDLSRGEMGYIIFGVSLSKPDDHKVDLDIRCIYTAGWST